MPCYITFNQAYCIFYKLNGRIRKKYPNLKDLKLMYKNKTKEEIDILFEQFPKSFKENYGESLDINDLSIHLKQWLYEKKIELYKSAFESLSPITLRAIIKEIDLKLSESDPKKVDNLDTQNLHHQMPKITQDLDINLQNSSDKAKKSKKLR